MISECNPRLRKRKKKIYSEYDDDIFLPFEIPPILIEEEKSFSQAKNGFQSKTEANARLSPKSAKKSANETMKSVKTKYKTKNLSSKSKIHTARKLKKPPTSVKTKQYTKLKTKTKFKTKDKQTGESTITAKAIESATSSHISSHITSHIRPCTVKVGKRSLKQFKASKIKRIYRKNKNIETKESTEGSKEIKAKGRLGCNTAGVRPGGDTAGARLGGDTEGSRKGWRIPACILEIVPEHVPR